MLACMTCSRDGAPSSLPTSLPWALVAALGCTANPPTTAARSRDPSRDAPPETAEKAPPKPARPERPITPPEALPGDAGDDELATPLLDVQIPVTASTGPLHMVARRYGPLRLQRLARDQLSVRGDLAVALADVHGQLHRARSDLEDINLAAVATIGDIQAFGGRWPDRAFLVGWEEELRDGSPTVWRRVNNDWHRFDNTTYDMGKELQWTYDQAAPWLASESLAVRVLYTVAAADPGELAPGDPPPAASAPVRALLEILEPAVQDDPRAPKPAPVPIHRNADTPDAVPGPEAAAPELVDGDAPELTSRRSAPELDENGLLPTAAPANPDPPAVEPATEPVPSTSPAPSRSPRSPRPAPPAPALKFPRLPHNLIPRDIATTPTGTVYVLASDGEIHVATPRPRKPGKWTTTPDTDLPPVAPGDLIRLYTADSGHLYILACLAEAPYLKRLDGANWVTETLPSKTVCPTSLAEADDGTLWLATAPTDGHTLWQRASDGAWQPVELPRLPWAELSWERWFAYVPLLSDHAVWERDPPPRNPPPLSPELRASKVVAHRGDVWILASASVGRTTVPHVVLSTRRAPFAIEFPAAGEEGLDAEDTGDRPFDETCSTPFLHLRDLAADEHGADQLPPLRESLGVRAEFADTVLVEALRSDGRRQLGAIWTNADALDEGFGPLGELGGAIDKLRPDVEPTMLCLIPRVRYGVEVRAR